MKWTTPTCAASLLAVLCLAATGSADAKRGGAPRNKSAPRISGAMFQGKTLSGHHGRWTDRPKSYRYAWLSCSRTGKSCRRVPGAKHSKYRLAARDVGHRMRLFVVARNRAGSGSARSKPTALIAGATSPQPPPGPPPPAPPPPPPPGTGLHVVGNQLLDGNGRLVHLHGVNRSGTEYACIQGWGIFDGPSSDASVAAIASWHSNIVRLHLNEDCILGVNGVPPQYAGANYKNAVLAFVSLLHQHHLYAELSLAWAAPGSQQATGHPKILDQDHSPDALREIAGWVRDDPNTVINLQSEPHEISWACWKNGGSSCSVGYAALGMQGALDAVRSTGASNVVLVSGIDWANNISQWLGYRPADASGQLMAEAHVYGNNVCSSTSCMDTQMAPVAAAVPLLFGETGETYDDSSCGSTNIQRLIGWADAHGVGYEPWVWNTWGTCGSLISNYDGTPANTYGTWVRNHYLGFPPP